MTIHISARAAFFISLGLVLVAVNLSENHLATREVYRLVKSVHFNLVQAPLEAAINDVRSTIDKITPKE